MKKVSFGWLAGPLLCFIMLAFFIGIERAGIRYEYQLSHLTWIPLDNSAEKDVEEAAECAILYDSGWNESLDHKNAISYVLRSMRIPHDIVDAANEDFPNLTRYKTLVIAFNNLDIISSSILNLSDWVESGGRVLFAVIPDITATMNMIYPKLGIQYGKFSYYKEAPLSFKTNLLPGTKDMEFNGEVTCGSSMVLRVADHCTVHITTCDEKQIPLLWECSYGKGKFVVNNNDLMKEKGSRGIVCAAYSLLEDICIYPVMNFSLFFIDDFPAPIPEGTHDVIYKECGYNIENFFKNIWWPDMLQFSKEHGLKYTGMVVETYNDNVTGPFTAEYKLESYRYCGGLLLKNGGAIGLRR